MPIYEYRCTGCKRKVTILTLRVSEAVDPVCEHCGSRALTRLMSRFALGRSEERRLDSLADDASIADGVIVLDHAGRITDLNPAAEQLTGMAASQAAGGEVGTLFHTSPWVDEMARGTLVEGAARRRGEGLLAARGHEVPVSATCAPVVDTEGRARGAVLVLHDLTLQHTLEATTRRADRLAALGTVASGLAHEIKNPLGGIKGAAQLLRGALSDPELVRCTDIIIREGARALSLRADRGHGAGHPRGAPGAALLALLLDQGARHGPGPRPLPAHRRRARRDDRLRAAAGARGPLSRDPSREPGHGPVSSDDARAAAAGSILVADDEESVRWVLERACTRQGHSVVAVGSGTAALAELRARPFDVALG